MAPADARTQHRLRLGLRGRIVILFALGALAVSLISTTGTYLVARQLLVDQRERVSVRQAISSSHYVAARASQQDELGRTLAQIPTGPSTLRLVHSTGQWYSAQALPDDAPVPATVRRNAESGDVSYAWSELRGEPVLVVGVPLPDRSMTYYEVSSARDLRQTLDTLRGVLVVMASLGTLSGVVVGMLAARRTVRPLQQVAAAGRRIGAGEYSTRLPETDDPGLLTIATAFNRMATQVEARIERDARFAADVGHELRSPMTTLVAAVGLLQAHRDQVPKDTQVAVDLAGQEVARFESTLEDLLRLGALDGGQPLHLRRCSASAALRATLEATRRPTGLLVPAPGPDTILVDKDVLHRAMTNLLDNADRHAGGATAVLVRTRPGWVDLVVQDAGRGVPEHLRERIFDRFVRGGARGSKKGTGLGLSIVAESAAAHGGRALCQPREGGGTEFIISLPAAPGGHDA